ncbi:MAG: hypothetical protein ACRD2C_08775 [Acidimicrobiales bacterium]
MLQATPRQEDAQQRVHELLAELVAVIGPASDGSVDFEPGEAPCGAPTLWEWVLACCWVDDDRKEFVTVVPAAGMLTHHAVGLLRAALALGDYDPAAGWDPQRGAG